MKVTCFLSSLVSFFFITIHPQCSLSQPIDPRQFADAYAPIVQFNTVGVKYLPTGFHEAAGTCTYVNIKPGYVFQYWFYYKKDIRIDPASDQAIKQALEQAARLQQSVDLTPLINKAFHDHDWELVEVTVPQLGQAPSQIAFCSHGARHFLAPNAFPIAAPMQGHQCVVKIVTDMHGCYPAGPWTPTTGGYPNLSAQLEFAIILAKELFANYNPVVNPPPYQTINFAGKCRSFSQDMMRVHQADLPGYPYPMPWDRGFNY